MRSTLAHALLVAGLALVAPAHAQFGVPTPAVQADSHIFSAFTTRTDPNVLAENVTLGPRLREQLGAEPRRRKVYDALMASVAGKPLQSHSLSAAEAAEFTALGLNAADPLVMVEAGEVRLLMQYSIAEKNVTFVEQLANATIAAPAPPPEAKPQAEAPKPEPVVERPLPTEAPPAAVVAPAAVATPKPRPAAAAPKPALAAPTPPAPAPRVAPPVVAAPAMAPVVATPAVAPKVAAPAKPRGDCVIKPVMTEEDLWNCSAPGQASNPLVSTPAPAAAAATSTFAPQPSAAQSTPRECVIKPVMTEEDLRICAAEKRSQAVAPREVSAPAGGAAAPAAPPVASVQMQSAPPQPAAAPRECVIKPVMTEDDLRACAAERRSQPVTPKEVSIPSPSAAPAPATAATAAPAAAPVQRECVIKPVMSEEDLRACASVKRSTPMTATEAPAATYAAPPAPTPASAPRECVVKPVMTEDELRACGSRR